MKSVKNLAKLEDRGLALTYGKYEDDKEQKEILLLYDERDYEETNINSPWWIINI